MACVWPNMTCLPLIFKTSVKTFLCSHTRDSFWLNILGPQCPRLPDSLLLFKLLLCNSLPSSALLKHSYFKTQVTIQLFPGYSGKGIQFPIICGILVKPLFSHTLYMSVWWWWWFSHFK